MPALTSAAGLVGFLSEPDPTLQAFALERLNEEIDSVWTEVTGSIGQMYVCREVRIYQQGYLAFDGLPQSDERS
jgi:26S proteasome regulatory subunit N2